MIKNVENKFHKCFLDLNLEPFLHQYLYFGIRVEITAPLLFHRPLT
jgi:hypothetical protein